GVVGLLRHRRRLRRREGCPGSSAAGRRRGRLIGAAWAGRHATAEARRFRVLRRELWTRRRRRLANPAVVVAWLQSTPPATPPPRPGPCAAGGGGRQSAGPAAIPTSHVAQRNGRRRKIAPVAAKLGPNGGECPGDGALLLHRTDGRDADSRDLLRPGRASLHA